MTLLEVAKHVLEAMEDAMERADTHEFYDAKESLRYAIEQAEQAEQEPVDSPEKAGAYMDARLWEFIDMAAAWPETRPDSRTWDHVMVYAPTPRKPLTYDELEPLCEAFDSYDTTQNELVEFARAIERAHGITGDSK